MTDKGVPTGGRGNTGGGAAELDRGGDGTNPLRNTVAVVVALLALVALAATIAVLWGKADDPNNETAWARWTFLLAGVEAIAFAGAGFLFGREVNRATVKAVTNEADKAQKSAQSAQEEANRHADRAGSAEGAGKVLRNAIAAKASVAAGSGAPEDEDLGQADPSNHLQELRELAERSFPD